jgi:hypothetical protein
MVVKLAFESYIAAQPEKFGDRSGSVGASEIGACARKIAWLKQGEKGVAVNGWGATHRGDIIEKHLWVPAMRHVYGANLRYAGAAQHTFVDGPLSATPDGLVINQKPDALKHLGIKDIKSDCFTVECKSIDPRVNIDEEKTINRIQVQVQMGMFRRFTKYKPQFAVLSYIDASWMDNVSEFVIKYDDALYEALKRRAERIMDKSVKQKPEGWIGGGWQCRYCEYLDKCNVDRRQLPFAQKEIDPQKEAELVDLCRQINAISSKYDEVDTQKRELQEQLKERLREWKIREIKGVFRWQSIKGRASYDIEAMRKAKINVDKYVREGEPSDRLTINSKLSADI